MSRYFVSHRYNVARRKERSAMKTQLTEVNKKLRSSPHNRTLQMRKSLLKRELHRPRSQSYRR